MESPCKEFSIIQIVEMQGRECLKVTRPIIVKEPLLKGYQNKVLQYLPYLDTLVRNSKFYIVDNVCIFK